jgi:hypothetical protein
MSVITKKTDLGTGPVLSVARISGLTIPPRFLEATNCVFTNCALLHRIELAYCRLINCTVDFDKLTLDHTHLQHVKPRVYDPRPPRVGVPGHGLIGPMRVDGFHAWAYWGEKGPMLRVGCRHFTLEEAKKHWMGGRAPSRSTVRAFVRFVEAVAKDQGWTKAPRKGRTKT